MNFVTQPITGTSLKRFTSFLNIHMRNKYTYIVGLPCILCFVFGAMLVAKSAKPAIAEAGPPPEAITIAEGVKKDIEEFAKGDAMEIAGHRMKISAEAAAKGKELTLCGDYQLRYDRASDKLLPDENCPLL